VRKTLLTHCGFHQDVRYAERFAPQGLGHNGGASCLLDACRGHRAVGSAGGDDGSANEKGSISGNSNMSPCDAAFHPHAGRMVVPMLGGKYGR